MTGIYVHQPYTPDELRAQVSKMWLRQYPDGPTDQNWLLQVGIGAGMLSVAADRISELEETLQRIVVERDDVYKIAWQHTDRIIELEAALREIAKGDCICSRAQEARAALKEPT